MRKNKEADFWRELPGWRLITVQGISWLVRTTDIKVVLPRRVWFTKERLFQLGIVGMAAFVMTFVFSRMAQISELNNQMSSAQAQVGSLLAALVFLAVLAVVCRDLLVRWRTHAFLRAAAGHLVPLDDPRVAEIRRQLHDARVAAVMERGSQEAKEQLAYAKRQADYALEQIATEADRAAERKRIPQWILDDQPTG